MLIARSGVMKELICVVAIALEASNSITLSWFETLKETVRTFAREAAIVSEATHLVARSDRLPQHDRVVAPH